jgi:hypothetical protein
VAATVSTNSTSASPAPSGSVQAPVARLVAGGLSFLLVLAFALAAGVPTARLLATVGGSQTAPEADRAVAPQVVERQDKRLAQERPAVEGNWVAAGDADDNDAIQRDRAAHTARPQTLVREALLALPPPAAMF